MKKQILTLTLLVASTVLFAQSSFDTEMKEAGGMFENAKTIQQLDEVSQKYASIYEADDDVWLALYYSTIAGSIRVFSEQDSLRKLSYIEEALTKAAAVAVLKPEESEVYVLKAMVYQMKIMVNPHVNGPEYNSLVMQLFAKAKELNPDNPRAYYLHAMQIMHTPEQYGGGKKAALPLFEKAVALYGKEDETDKSRPHWGKEDCLATYEKCKE